MFTKPTRPSELQEPIDQVLRALAMSDPDDENYAKLVKQLEKLKALKELDKPSRVDANTIAIISANLLGIVIIVGHERAHVVTSKALSFVSKLK